MLRTSPSSDEIAGTVKEVMPLKKKLGFCMGQ